MKIETISKQVRLDIIKMINKGSSSHIGSALSCVDLVLSVYKYFLNYDPNNPTDPDRDIFILSKGHAGAALAMRKKNQSRKVCVLMSDGECDEGSIWEAAMFASHHKLSNLLCIIDYNKLQSLDTVSNTLELEPFSLKWESFGWKALEIDGHDFNAIKKALNSASESERPVCIIANTTKGKGVSFMEDSVLWHYRTPKDDEFDDAINELNMDDQ